MHIAAKIFLIIGAIVSVGGIIAIAMGASQIDDLDDSWNTFEVEDGTNGSFQIVDEDGVGDSGVTFWVKGVYEDKNENDIWDVCENFSVTIIEKPDVNKSWPLAGDGGFYNESDQPLKECYTGDDKNNKNTDRVDKGLVKVGRACYACYSGNFTFESNQKVWVTNDDVVNKKIAEDGLGVFLGFAGGFGGICCGIIFLIIGGILAFTIKDNNAQEMTYMPPADNQLITQQTVDKSTTTHMSQPDFGDKT